MEPSSIAEVMRRNPKTSEEIPEQRVYLRVLEPFRGTSEPEVEVVTDFSSCGFHFDQGTSYLVYAHRDEETGKLTTGACSGTTRVDSNPAELQYLRGLITGTTKGEVFGFVTLHPTDMVVPFRANKPIAGAPVILKSGDRTWKTSTNDNGEYSFLGLEADRYEISVDLPNAPVTQTIRNFELTGQTCSRQNFLGTPVGKISGRLLDSEGVPIKGLLIDLVALPPIPQPEPIFWPQSKDDGRFEYPRLEAGEYILGVNLKEPVNKRSWYGNRVPYAASYYPGVTDHDRAQVLKLEPGQNLEGIEFRLPPNPAAVTFRGKVMARRSRERTLIALIDPEFPKEKSQVDAVVVAADGSFELTGVEGRRYILVAHLEKPADRPPPLTLSRGRAAARSAGTSRGVSPQRCLRGRVRGLQAILHSPFAPMGRNQEAP